METLWKDSDLAVLESWQRSGIDGVRVGTLVTLDPAVTFADAPDGPVVARAHNEKGRSLVEAIAADYGAALIYISPGHWVELGKPDWVLEHHIWTAHWRVAAPAWPDDWAIWQTTGSGTHPGVKVSQLDLNVARSPLPLIA